jgi:DNA-directed RNA polymerase I subunit RPA12
MSSSSAKRTHSAQAQNSAAVPEDLIVFAPALEAGFCPRCGSLLVVPDEGTVLCDQCPFSLPLRTLPTTTVVTRSYPRPEPEWLQEHRAQQAQAAQAAARSLGKGDPGAAAGGAATKPGRATINEECPKCHAPTMEFYTMQLRSADEGQTVFYECAGSEGCGYKYSVNT